MKEVMEFCSLGGSEAEPERKKKVEACWFGKCCWCWKFASWRTALCPGSPETIELDGSLAPGRGGAGERSSALPSSASKGRRDPSHGATQDGSKQLRRAHLESVAVLGPNPPHRFISVSFHPSCLVLSPTERSEAPNCTIQIIPNTVIRNRLIKILIATLKCFLWNYRSCQYLIINVRKSDYLFNKNREIPAFKLIIVANQNAMIMHENFGLQL